MISLITCSIDPEKQAKLKINVAETIGVPYELIIIDNRNTGTGICAAYNKGGRAAQYEILCFLHDDISFETLQWGLKLLHHIQEDGFGLVGVAGSSVKNKVPSSWASTAIENEIHLTQHFKREPKPPQYIKRSQEKIIPSITQVASIDGVLMATTRELFTLCPFDEERFPGFHGYDLDFSLQLGQYTRVGVSFEIHVQHFSEGHFSDEWLDAAIQISRKWDRILPLSTKDYGEKEMTREYWTSMATFIRFMYQLNWSKSKILQHFLQFSFQKYFNVFHFLHCLKRILQNQPAKI
jgi:hypothetical protein